MQILEQYAELRYSPDQPRDPNGEFASGSGDSKDPKDLTEADAAAAGLDVGAGYYHAQDLEAAQEDIRQQMAQLEAKEDADKAYDPDEDPHYLALMMMDRVLFLEASAKLSERQYFRTAVAFRDGKLVAAGAVRIDTKGKTAHVNALGSTERGAGKYVMASLIQQVRERLPDCKTITADASRYAIKFNESFGFKVSGSKNENGTPMTLKLDAKDSRSVEEIASALLEEFDPETRYSEDEPRDPDGRWTSGGGTSTTAAEQIKRPEAVEKTRQTKKEVREFLKDWTGKKAPGEVPRAAAEAENAIRSGKADGNSVVRAIRNNEVA